MKPNLSLMVTWVHFQLLQLRGLKALNLNFILALSHAMQEIKYDLQSKAITASKSIPT